MLGSNNLSNPFNPASPYYAAAAQYYGAGFASYVSSPALLYLTLARSVLPPWEARSVLPALAGPVDCTSLECMP